jgi:hypothetical protein
MTRVANLCHSSVTGNQMWNSGVLGTAPVVFSTNRKIQLVSYQRSKVRRGPSPTVTVVKANLVVLKRERTIGCPCFVKRLPVRSQQSTHSHHYIPVDITRPKWTSSIRSRSVSITCSWLVSCHLLNIALRILRVNLWRGCILSSKYQKQTFHLVFRILDLKKSRTTEPEILYSLQEKWEVRRNFVCIWIGPCGEINIVFKSG